MTDRLDVQQQSLSSSARSTALVMAATTVSRLLGFVRQAAVNAVFGATGTADVLNAVFNIPNNLRKLMAEGALSSAFIPILSQVESDPELRRQGVPRQIVRSLLTFQYTVLVPVMVLCVVFARPITGFILDFAEPERQELAARLFSWFIHYTLLISVSAVLMGTLNSSGRFGVPATTPILFSVSVIASVLLLSGRLGMHAMSVGILIGGAAQIAYQLPEFRRAGFDLRLSFAFGTPHFRRIMRQWLPVVASSSVFAVNQQISLYFASGLESGSASALANALIFWQLPIGIFGVSIMTVLFPRMSREAGRGDVDALRGSVGFGIRGMIALLLPSALLLALLAGPVIAVAFQRGNFTAADTTRASRVLAGYCIGMVGVGSFNFLQRFFYSRGDYRTPTLTAVAVLVLDVSLSLWLKETVLRVTGLAVANSVAFSAGAAVLLVAARRTLGGIGARDMAVTFGKSLLAIVPAGVLLVVQRIVWGDWWLAGSSIGNAGRLAGLGLAAVLVTGLLYIVLKVEAATMFMRRFRRA